MTFQRVEMLKDAILKFIKDDEGGTETVSFILLVPLFMLVIAMMLTYGQMIFATTVAMHASTSGIRAAVIQDSKSAARNAADSVASDYVRASGFGCSFAGSELQSGSWTRGNIAKYYVTVRINTAFPLAYGSFKKSYAVTKPGIMMIE